ncbi:XRE family transcriptional regulator [Denitromonas halophila]|uniref:XRE family transcriptional regulator n=1 Tax=Denitromonas halophila TaxID=1629404 RepID=A0A557QXD5_9RHOO|nr:XRE family transcriptional regulator [Denitromonas halophila]TVO57563.1 XRE family transcriptional regulator [Denitromonas halophila]
MATNATPDWRALFDAAVEKDGAVRVAARLGYNNHTLVSRIANGHVPGSGKFQQRVIDRYFVVAECPATEREQPRSECRRLSRGAAPTHNPLSMRIWKTCQRCPHKPEVE